MGKQWFDLAARLNRLVLPIMETLSLTQLVPILQLAVGPVILISGVGLLMLTLTNRFGRMIDRTRSIINEIVEKGHSPVIVANLNKQLLMLQRRSRILRLSISLAAVSVLGVGVLILGLFVAALWRLEMTGVLVAIFCAAIFGLIGSMIAFIIDMNLSLKAAQLDWRRIEQMNTK